MKSTFGDVSNISKNKGLNFFDFKTAGFSGPIMNPCIIYRCRLFLLSSLFLHSFVWASGLVSLDSPNALLAEPAKQHTCILGWTIVVYTFLDFLIDFDPLFNPSIKLGSPLVKSIDASLFSGFKCFVLWNLIFNIIQYEMCADFREEFASSYIHGKLS